MGAFTLQIDAFVKLLHHLHGFLGGKVQLAARFLLQGRSGKGRRGSLFLFPVLDAVDGEPGVLHPLLRFHGFRFVVQLGLLAVQGIEPQGEGGFPAAGAGQQRVGGNIPVFLGDKVLDVLLTIHHQPGGDRLHASGAQAFFHLGPQKRADLVAHQPIQGAAGLLGVHPFHVDGTGIFQRGFHGLLGHFMEFDAAGRGHIHTQGLGQVPGNSFSFAVRVGCQKDFGSVLGFLSDLGEDLASAMDGDVLHGEVLIHVHTQLGLGQVAHVPLGRFHFVAPPQKFGDGARLGGRFHDNQFRCSCHGCCPPNEFLVFSSKF